MIALLGFATIFIFLYLILTNKTSVIVALILIPVALGLLTGNTTELGEMMLDGIIDVAPTAIMLAFAILYFGLMNHVGLFDPIINKILKAVKGDPVKITVGTALIAMLAHLDGSTFLIAIPPLLPLYDRIGIRRLVLAGVVALGAGTMNLLPWGGPTARASTVLGVETSDIFNPVIPAMIVGLVWVIFVAYLLGKKERKRLGINSASATTVTANDNEEVHEDKSQLPKLFWFNMIFTIIVIVFLVKAWIPLAVFMIAFAISVVINFPKPDAQQKIIESLSKEVVTITTIIFAAGIFTGVLQGTGMIEAMANALVALIPNSLGNFMALFLAIASMPLSLVFTPDAFYFGVLPILSEAASNYGITGVEMGRASILGQITTGFPLSPMTPSTFLLIGLAGVGLGEHQHFIFKWAFGTTIVMSIVAVITGVISIS